MNTSTRNHAVALLSKRLWIYTTSCDTTRNEFRFRIRDGVVGRGRTGYAELTVSLRNAKRPERFPPAFLIERQQGVSLAGDASACSRRRRSRPGHSADRGSGEPEPRLAPASALIR